MVFDPSTIIWLLVLVFHHKYYSKWLGDRLIIRFHKLLPGHSNVCKLLVKWCFWSLYYHRLTSIGLITYTTPCGARTEWRLCFISYYPASYIYWSLYCCVVFYPPSITELPVLDSVHICSSVQCEERIIIEFHKILPVWLNVCTLLVKWCFRPLYYQTITGISFITYTTPSD